MSDHSSNRILIALWLGHESTETTHVNVEADLATKERALHKLAPVGADIPVSWVIFCVRCKITTGRADTPQQAGTCRS